MDFTRAAEEIVKTSKFFLRHYSLDNLDEKINAALKYLEEKELMGFIYELPDAYLYKVIPLSLVVLDKEEVLRFVEVLMEVKNLVKEGLTVYYSSEFWVWLLSVVSRLKNDYDYVLVVDGYEGSGKSMSAMSIAYFYRRIVLGKKLERQNVVFSPQEIAQTFGRWVSQDTHYDVLVIDEGGAALFSRESMSKLARKFIKLFKIARMMNWFVILVAQNITWVDVYIRKHRITGWISKQTRSESLFVGGAEFKKNEEWQHEHFDVASFLKKVKTERFLFSDFVFDPDFLKDYRMHKQEFVKNSVEELMDLVGESLESIEKKVENVISEGLSTAGIPYAVPAGDILHATFLYKRADYLNRGTFTTEFLKGFPTLNEDPLSELLFSEDRSNKQLQKKKAILEALGLPGAVADFYALANFSYRKSDVIFTYFDIWRLIVLGFIEFRAQKEIFTHNLNPLVKPLIFARELIASLGSDTLIKTQLVLYSDFSATVKHRASAYLFKLDRKSFQMDSLFSIVAQDLSAKDVMKWLYHNLLLHIQLFLVFFSKPLIDAGKGGTSKKELSSAFEAYKTYLEGDIGDRGKYYDLINKAANSDVFNKALGTWVAYNSSSSAAFQDIINKYLFTKINEQYFQILTSIYDVSVGNTQKIIDVMKALKEMHKTLETVTPRKETLSEFTTKFQQEAPSFELDNPQYTDYIINMFTKNQEELKELNKLLFDLFLVQVNSYQKLLAETKEIVESCEYDLDELEKSTQVSLTPTKEEALEEINKLEELLLKIKSLPDFYELNELNKEAEEDEI
ncbi:MAG: zonular occludens toxin domain-containing protein [Candidatus Aenigmatarchaeota archaeon]